jgi:hypothetical protein
VQGLQLTPSRTLPSLNPADPPRPQSPIYLELHFWPGSSSCFLVDSDFGSILGVFWSLFCTLIQGHLLPRRTAVKSERCSTSPQTAFDLIQNQLLHKRHSISSRLSVRLPRKTDQRTPSVDLSPFWRHPALANLASLLTRRLWSTDCVETES